MKYLADVMRQWEGKTVELCRPNGIQATARLLSINADYLCFTEGSDLVYLPTDRIAEIRDLADDSIVVVIR